MPPTINLVRMAKGVYGVPKGIGLGAGRAAGAGARAGARTAGRTAGAAAGARAAGSARPRPRTVNTGGRMGGNVPPPGMAARPGQKALPSPTGPGVGSILRSRLMYPVYGALAGGALGGISGAMKADPYSVGPEQEHQQKMYNIKRGILMGVLGGGLGGLGLGGGAALGLTGGQTAAATLGGLGLGALYGSAKAWKYNPTLPINRYYGGPSYNPALQEAGPISSLMQIDPRARQGMMLYDMWKHILPPAYGHANW